MGLHFYLWIKCSIGSQQLDARKAYTA